MGPVAAVRGWPMAVLEAAVALLGLEVALGWVNVPGHGGGSVMGSHPSGSWWCHRGVRCWKVMEEAGLPGKGPWCSSLCWNRVAAPAVLSLRAKSLPMAGGTGCLCWGGQGTLQPMGRFGLSPGGQTRHRDKDETNFAQEKLHVLLH